MKLSGSRRLIVPGLCALAVAYFLTAGRLEQGAIASQAPAVATGEALRHCVDRALLMSDVRALASPAFEGRRTSSPGGLKARQWIVDRFKTLGLIPAGPSGYLEPFSFTHQSIRGLITPGRPFRTTYSDAANVLGAIAGASASAKTIVISAHYDHLGVRDGAMYAGADDNASGIATLLAIAGAFTGEHPVHRLVFAAFDAEELGLRGAETFVTSGLVPLDVIALEVNLDMVSRNERNEIFASGTYQSPWLKPLLQDVQRRSGVRILFGHDRPIHKAGSVEDWTDQSDHGAFAERGVPFVYFGVEDHADYHQPSDTADKIDSRFFGDAADMIVEAVKTFDAKIE
jgi:acetylornithine deacetylase/succinyl-diaminopimelate desuccinylase-like protein